MKGTKGRFGAPMPRPPAKAAPGNEDAAETNAAPASPARRLAALKGRNGKAMASVLAKRLKGMRGE